VEIEKYLDQDARLRIHLISGTVSGTCAIDSFNTRLGRYIAPEPKKYPERDRLRFERVVENDDVAIRRFLEYLDTSGKRPTKLALLAEDETEYGSCANLWESPTQHEERLVIRYPRNIAGLRNAYLEGDSPQAGGPLIVPEGLKFTLKDSLDGDLSHLSDSIPDFSKLQGPASQNSALSAISTALRNERASYIGIISTDILDSEFLSHVLRSSCPDARLFTLDADLLYLREIETQPLAGMLSVTTYPLFSRNQHWTGAQLAKGVGRRVLFTSRAGEGIYNASRLLLQVGKPPRDGHDFVLEYADPRLPKSRRPPLWLTVLGRDGYWPVALLSQTANDSVWTTFLLDAQVSGRSPTPTLPHVHSELPPRGWYVLLWLVLLAAVLHSVYVLYLLSLIPVVQARVAPVPKQWPWQVRFAHEMHVKMRSLLQPETRSRAIIRMALRLTRDSVRALKALFPDYRDSSEQPLYGHKLPFLLAITLVFACVLALLVFALRMHWSVPLGIIPSSYDAWRIAYGIMLACGIGVLFLACAALFARSTEKVCSRRFSDKRCISSFREYWPIIALTVFTAVSTIGIFGYLVLHNDYERGMFFAYRSLLLTSGVSPLAPILLASLAYFSWSWIQLHREDMIASREFLKTYASGIDTKGHTHIVGVDSTLENIFSIFVWRPAMLFLAVWLVVFQPWRTLRSVEPRLYDWLYLILLVVLYWMLTLCWTHFIWIWSDFRDLLQWLERNPVRNAFSRLRKEFAWLPLVSTIRSHQLFVTGRCLDTLSAIRNFDPKELPDRDAAALALLQTALEETIAQQCGEPYSLADTLERTIADGRDGIDVPSYATLHAGLDRIGAIILDHLHKNQWKGRDSDSVRREEQTDTVRALSPVRRILVLEEEYIALRYLIFMRYVFRHLRSLLGFVVAGFILTAISLQSYAFGSRHWIEFSSVCIFGTLGIGVARVFAEMDRDAILSRITDTKGNELGKNFVFRIIQFGALPLLTILAGQFPSIGRLVYSWVRPALDSLH
jgi:hypothetical protein